jgi:hypothetical protein
LAASTSGSGAGRITTSLPAMHGPANRATFRLR